MTTIDYTDCRITIGEDSTAYIKWKETAELTRIDEVDDYRILPSSVRGIYYLGEEGIVHHLKNNFKKSVVNAENWFSVLQESSLFYFPQTNVLMVTSFQGDNNYIWWWNLAIYDQEANVEQPIYFNGSPNNGLTLEKVDERFAVSHYYVDPDPQVVEDPQNDNDFQTIVFDTLTMTMTTFTGRLSGEDAVALYQQNQA